MKTNSYYFVWLPILASAFIAMQSANLQSAERLSPTEEQEVKQCEEQLKDIYKAIQAYRRDHKELPDWLSDLYPTYLQDTNMLICSASRRTDRFQTYGIEDPKLKSSYIYEFCVQQMPRIIWGGSPLRMQDWKRLQMAIVGDKVPMLRCANHFQSLPPDVSTLNMSFGGEYYQSPITWEMMFADVVEVGKLSPSALMSKFGVSADNPGAAKAPQPTKPTALVSAQSPLINAMAPDFELELLSGGKFKLSDYRDKNILLLDFWATWCGPCRKAMPVLEEVSENYKDRGVKYFAIDLREDPEKIQAYLQREKLNIEVPLDSQGDVGKLYNIRSIPTLLVIDIEGKLHSRHVGFKPNLAEVLGNELDAILP